MTEWLWDLLGYPLNSDAYKQEEKDQLIRFFDHKSFFTVHGDAATSVAQQYYKTSAVVKQYGSSPETALPGAAGAYPAACLLSSMHPSAARGYFPIMPSSCVG